MHRFGELVIDQAKQALKTPKKTSNVVAYVSIPLQDQKNKKCGTFSTFSLYTVLGKTEMCRSVSFTNSVC